MKVFVGRAPPRPAQKLRKLPQAPYMKIWGRIPGEGKDKREREESKGEKVREWEGRKEK